MVPTRRYYGDDFCVIEHEWQGTVPGSFLGVPGNGRHITFRMLHTYGSSQTAGSSERTCGWTAARS
jgi:hypothetical protein